MASIEVSERLPFFGWIDGRRLLRLLRLFAMISTLYGFWVVFSMDEYLPWKARFVRGVMWTTIGHFGLWLAMFEWRSKFRFVAAAFLLVSMVGTLVLWWYVGAVVVGLLGWRLFQLLKGAPNESQSV